MMHNDNFDTQLNWKEGLKKYFHDLFDIKRDTMSFEELDKMMRENTIINGANMWILVLAILIASIGLNVNSTAVIIGAMLISPLMSAILTMGYSLATKHLRMLKRAFVRFGTQVIISLIASTIYFMLTPLTEPTAEMIARTSPTLWDVMIALFGGIAGTIGNTRVQKGNVVPGVAIATALMPPLCTAGYGLATLQPRFLFGAFYLFLINTLFITLSAAFVIKMLGVPSKKNVDEARQRHVNHLMAVIVIIAIIPSIIIGAATVSDSVREKNVKAYLTKEFVFPETQVVQSRVDTLEHTIHVSLVGAQVSEDVIARLEQSLANYKLEGYSLQVTQNQFTAEDTTDQVTIAVQENTINELQKELQSKDSAYKKLQNQLEEQANRAQNQIDWSKLLVKASTIFPQIEGLSCGFMNDEAEGYVLFTGQVDVVLTEEELQIFENWIMTETGHDKVQIHLELTEPIDESIENEE